MWLSTLQEVTGKDTFRKWIFSQASFKHEKGKSCKNIREKDEIFLSLITVVYVRIFLVLKSHFEVLRGKAWCVSLSNVQKNT